MTDIAFAFEGGVIAARKWQAPPMVGDVVFLGGQVERGLVVEKVIWDGVVATQEAGVIVWLGEGSGSD